MSRAINRGAMGILCSLEGCGQMHYGRGYCKFHFDRVKRGTPLDAPKRLPLKPFAEYVTAGAPDECWEWRGPVRGGYGSHRRKAPAHRVAYELAKGPIPPRLQIDHLCRNTLCVNPTHLEAVTQGENMRRGTAPAALVVQMNRCMRGHELVEPNVYYRPDGRGRDCKACMDIRKAARKERR